MSDNDISFVELCEMLFNSKYVYPITFKTSTSLFVEFVSTNYSSLIGRFLIKSFKDPHGLYQHYVAINSNVEGAEKWLANTRKVSSDDDLLPLSRLLKIDLLPSDVSILIFSFYFRGSNQTKIELSRINFDEDKTSTFYQLILIWNLFFESNLQDLLKVTHQELVILQTYLKLKEDKQVPSNSAICDWINDNNLLPRADGTTSLTRQSFENSMKKLEGDIGFPMPRKKARGKTK